MVIISAKDITKAYGAEAVLESVNFRVHAGDRIGIIGANGAGKTTLMNLLSGGLEPDAGELYVAADLRAGYLRQSGNFRSTGTLREALGEVFGDLIAAEAEISTLSKEIARLAGTAADPEDAPRVAGLLERYDRLSEDFERRGGYAYESEITGMLIAMGFPESEHEKQVALLSGGERTRLALAALLLRKPELLFLDEPTNHLDIGMLGRLEQYLRAYAGTVVVVSHDRYFLDKTVTRVFEAEHHRLRAYEGNYTAFAEKKRENRRAEEAAYEAQQKEIARQEDMVRRFRQHGTEKLAKRARSRELRLSAVERIERPDREPDRVRFGFKQRYKSGNDVLTVLGLAKGFGTAAPRRELFAGVDLEIKKGEHICMVGANGVGKTTFLKLLTGELTADDGYIAMGHNVLIGYYDQEQENLNGDGTVLGEVSSALYGETEMRNLLGRFLFRGDVVFRRVDALSGGEKARLSLLKLMLSGANFLVLDEPTNHLDIASKEVFEEALREFEGTALIVSHDRYFLNRIPSRIVELTRDGIVNYMGAYDYYAEKKASERAGTQTRLTSEPAAGLRPVARPPRETAAEPKDGESPGEDAALRRRRNKAEQTEQRRRERELAEAEARIADIEAEIERLEAELCDEAVYSDATAAGERGGRLDRAKAALAEAYDRWAALAEPRGAATSEE